IPKISSSHTVVQIIPILDEPCNFFRSSLIFFDQQHICNDRDKNVVKCQKSTPEKHGDNRMDSPPGSKITANVYRMALLWQLERDAESGTLSYRTCNLYLSIMTIENIFGGCES